jgi:alpha-1,6-mannosyltransferase
MHETFGLVLLEAMACGRPVVAMRAGAVPELVPETVGTLATPHDDVAVAGRNFAEAVSALYERDPEALGRAARAHVEANYSWSRTLQPLMARYQMATGASRLPALGEVLARAD